MRETRRRRRGEGLILAAALAGLLIICIGIGMNRLPREISLGPVHAVSVEMPRLNLNTATIGELSKLPGIGETLAERIVLYRAKHGGFDEIAELMRVEGVGEGKFEAVRELICTG